MRYPTRQLCAPAAGGSRSEGGTLIQVTIYRKNECTAAVAITISSVIDASGGSDDRHIRREVSIDPSDRAYAVFRKAVAEIQLSLPPV